MQNLTFLERKHLYDLALKKWGLKAQMFKAIEEACEFTAALARNLNNVENSLDEVLDEMADIEIMVEQMKYGLGVKDAFDVKKEEKLRRLADRLKEPEHVIPEAATAPEKDISKCSCPPSKRNIFVPADNLYRCRECHKISPRADDLAHIALKMLKNSIVHKISPRADDLAPPPKKTHEWCLCITPSTSYQKLDDHTMRCRSCHKIIQDFLYMY